MKLNHAQYYRRRKLATGVSILIVIAVAVWGATRLVSATSAKPVSAIGSSADFWGATLPTLNIAIVTTTTDPGALPQTKQLPVSTGATFDAGVADLWRAIVDDNPQEAMPFFFPLSAYIQVKGISDPVHDFQTRLIPAYENDIHRLHADLGANPSAAQFVSFNVPEAQAEWILPGVEYNKGSYWRVYGSTLNYLDNGQAESFPIFSLISWRGEWYVVHIGPPTS